MPLRSAWDSLGSEAVPDYAIPFRQAPRPRPARAAQADECTCRQCIEAEWGPVPVNPPMRADHETMMLECLDGLEQVK